MGVIIPVLNEAENVEGIVADLKYQSIAPKQIMIVDGGSSDRTVELFEALGLEVISCSTKGRGNQLYAGLEKLTTDVVLVLHADKRLDKSLVEKVAKVCSADESLVGGAVGAHFVSKSFKYRVIEFLNNLRMIISGISFGDQGQFFRRKLVLEKDCLKRIPLMEDVELAMHLQNHGKVRKLDGGLNVSVRRWQHKPVWKNALQIFFLLFKYLFLRRLSKSINTQKFYEDYYSDAKPVNNT